MSGGTRVSYEELLEAGAVLPRGSRDVGERAVPLTARTYRQPGPDDRVVVRLVTEELGAAEDLAAGHAGFVPDGKPVEVGLAARRALGFPEWVLVHHPQDAQHALDVVPELERIARRAKSSVQAAMDDSRKVARRLAASVPHFLPTFHEQVGRIFLSAESTAYAAQMFTRAREAEAEHGLTVDEQRQDAVFLEFALAGAVSVKALSAYARDLAARLPAPEALDRFTRLCLLGSAGGLVPSVRSGVDIRRLARAVGPDGAEAEQTYLVELLALPAAMRAPTGWWKAQRTALVELARRHPSARGALLDAMPVSYDQDVLVLWLDVLEESGALAGLWDDTLPEERRPRDGTAGWFVRFLEFHTGALHWSEPARLPALYRLVERAADRLRTELAGSGRELEVVRDLDLLDLLLARNVPVAPFPENHRLPLEQWVSFDDRRDLFALAADERFQEVFHRSADGFYGSTDHLHTLRVLARSPGGRPMLADWVREVAPRAPAAGLPDLPEALGPLHWLPAEVLNLAEDEMRAAAAAGLAPLLARTLRTGLFDELGWPAWDEAARALVEKEDIQFLHVADAWPYLVVAGDSQVRVIDADGTVLVHDLRLPETAGYYDRPGFHFVDGELLVHWRTGDHGNSGYWHHTPDRIVALEGLRGARMGIDWYREETGVSTLPLPCGGRIVGPGVLHLGGTFLHQEALLLSDGDSYWMRGGDTWLGFDPDTGTLGPESMPAFLTEATLDAPEGSTFEYGTLLPHYDAEFGPAAAPVDELLGWRVIRLPDGSRRGEDLAGRRVTVPAGAGLPCAAVVFPGADRPVAASRDTGWAVHLVDADGVVTATARVDGAPGAFAEGTPILPPPTYWHCLRPRDPQGSAALRRIDDDTARALLGAASTRSEDELPDAVRELVPQVTHDALVSGIAGVLRFAAEQQAVLDRVAARLKEALTATGSESARRPYPTLLSPPLTPIPLPGDAMNTAYSPVTEFNLLMDLQDRIGYENFADGFGLTEYGDLSGLVAGWSDDLEFTGRLIPFAQATGGGSFYALWKIDDRTDLATLPVVVFGDEGGQHVVARDVRELFQLLGFDAEISVDWERAYFYRDEDEPYTEGRDEYVAWLDQHFGLPVATNPDAVLAAAQEELGQRFADWVRPFLP
ncbi:hypothetical protein ACFYXF_11440 [Streptomyces sp. NPDC002680]|uniref:hypothetical protein n=1 Tax=Streptomyces sp. NPDC002680 TaxID=3364659 RepID=UPI003676FFEC